MTASRVPELVHRCEPVPYPKIREPRVVGLESRIAHDKNRAGSLSSHCREGALEILGTSRFHRMELEPKPLCRYREVLPHKCLGRVGRVDEHRHEEAPLNPGRVRSTIAEARGRRGAT
jgi:hypothetical protein